MQNQAKVLWWSDIHFCHDSNINSNVGFPKKNKIKSYFDSIELTLKDIKPTHIVITGDLVFSGMHEQFDNMYDILLKKYLEENPSVRLITCCGNHEFDRFAQKKLKSLAPDLTELKDYINRKSRVEKIVKTENTSNNKRKIKYFLNNNPNYIYNFPNNNNKFNLFDLLFNGYISFYENKVRKRIDDINLKGGSIKFIGHNLANIIHDKDFNLIFITLNSSYLAWGDETYEELYKRMNSTDMDYKKAVSSKNIYFNEFGRLTYLIEDLDLIQNELSDLQSAKTLDENVVITISHAPFSWMSYEEIYEEEKLHYILNNSDLLLSGHIHVKNFESTYFRDRTYLFESPQLFDYHFYSAHLRTRDCCLLGNNHGFSYFTIKEDLSEFTQTALKVKNSDKMNEENPFQLLLESLTFTWNDHNYTPKKLCKVRFLNVFNFENRTYKEGCSLISYFKSFSNNGVIQSCNIELFSGNYLILNIDFKSYFNILFRDTIEQNFKYSLSTNSNYYSITHESEPDKLTLIIKNINELYSIFNEFFILNTLPDENQTIKLVNVLLFDIQIDYLYLTNNIKLKSISHAIELFRLQFNKYKEFIYSNLEESKNKDLLLKIGIGFDIIELKDYKKFILNKL